jgi:hypothetical protein
MGEPCGPRRQNVCCKGLICNYEYVSTKMAKLCWMDERIRPAKRGHEDLDQHLAEPTAAKRSQLESREAVAQKNPDGIRCTVAFRSCAGNPSSCCPGLKCFARIGVTVEHLCWPSVLPDRRTADPEEQTHATGTQKPGVNKPGLRVCRSHGYKCGPGMPPCCRNMTCGKQSISGEVIAICWRHTDLVVNPVKLKARDGNQLERRDVDDMSRFQGPKPKPKPKPKPPKVEPPHDTHHKPPPNDPRNKPKRPTWYRQLRCCDGPKCVPGARPCKWNSRP